LPRHRRNSENATAAELVAAILPAVTAPVAPSQEQKKLAISRVRNGNFRLPSGQRIGSNNPLKEFAKNVCARKAMLWEAGLSDLLPLVDLWEADAGNQRRGITDPGDRAWELGISLEELAEFDIKVEELEHDVWKKAADFYRGLLVSKIFDTPVLMRGGLYIDHEFHTWSSIQFQFGVSKDTVMRRIKAGVPVADLLRPARQKAWATYLEYQGATYSPAEFAAAFHVPDKRVRAGIAEGLSAQEILDAPKPRRGRPRATPLLQHTSPSPAIESLAGGI
jgi:hypothetical protein